MDRFTTTDGKVVGFEGDMDKLAEALLRLSEYENTGLLPGEVAELKKKAKCMENDIDYLLNRFSSFLEKRDSVEMTYLLAENNALKAKVEKYKEEVLTLQQRFEDAMDLVKQYGYEVLTLCKKRVPKEFSENPTPKEDS